jgi:hypothetical protein
MSGTDIRDDLHKAIYDELAGDATFMALVTNRLYDEPYPDNTSYPCVTIGSITLNDWSSHTHAGFDGEVMINTWTQYIGKKSVHEIMARIYTVLYDFDPAISGKPTINFRLTQSSTILDEDGRTYNGVQTFSIMFGGNST